MHCLVMQVTIDTKMLCLKIQSIGKVKVSSPEIQVKGAIKTQFIKIQTTENVGMLCLWTEAIVNFKTMCLCHTGLRKNSTIQRTAIYAFGKCYQGTVSV